MFLQSTIQLEPDGVIKWFDIDTSFSGGVSCCSHAVLMEVLQNSPYIFQTNTGIVY
jgi:hypothetical protein